MKTKRSKSHIAFLVYVCVAVIVCGSIAVAELIETFTYYPVSDILLSQDDTQYSDSIMTAVGDTESTGYSKATFMYLNVDVPIGIDRLANEVLTNYMHVVVETRASDTIGVSPDIRWFIEAKDTINSTWKLISDTQRTYAATLYSDAFTLDTLKGYVDPDTIQYVPFQVRIGLNSDSTDKGILRLVDDTYTETKYKAVDMKR